MTNINENNSTTDNTQSHWGSGVKYENIQIGPYVPPPADDVPVADRSVAAKKSVSLLAFLPWLFLIVAAFVGGTYYAGIAGDNDRNIDKSKIREQTIEKLKSIDWDQYVKTLRDRNVYISDKKVSGSGETYYELGPVRNGNVELISGNYSRKYRLFDPYFFSLLDYGEFFCPADSIPYVYAEHWNLRRTPPVWKHRDVAGYGAFLEAGEEDIPTSVHLLEKEMERIPLIDGADLSHRVFYACWIKDYHTRSFVLSKLNGDGSFFDKGLFENVTFKNCSFRRCCFEKCRFRGCIFDNCDFADCSFSFVEFSVTKVVDGNFEKAFWDHCEFGGADFSESSITLKQVRETAVGKEYKKDAATSEISWLQRKLKLPPDIQKALDEEKEKGKDKK
jgi:hypothetical protein